VIIVGWNNYDNTRECLQSILNQQQIGTEIFLVDNGSKTEPLDNLSLLFPEINYIYSEKNLGFAAGTNLGLQKALSAGYKYFLIINNDTRADLLMLSELVKPLKDENVGLVAPFIYYYDTPDKIWSCGGFINNVLLMPLDSHNVKKAVFNPTERTFLSGCCYLMRRELLERVGLFDERFFLYFEDLDYCLRVNETKWKMMVIPTAKLYHKVSQSSGGQMSESERFFYAKSSGLYFRKHINKTNALPIIFFRLGSALKMTTQLLIRGRFTTTWSYLHGLYQGWFGKDD
jgi:hypothetical protein